MINFKNTYVELPERFFQRISPENFNDPTLICFNTDLASDLGINFQGINEQELAQIFSGNKILEGSDPISLAYAAHQFGHFVPQLGDGRAHLIGEVRNFDLQLKGSGQTQFSRNGDGRSALGPVLREYIVSEAMHYLGVPTTRALAAVSSGERVVRQKLEPGGIFTRVAPSHIRVGTFQYFACRNDIEGLKILLDYAVKRHYPKLDKTLDLPSKALAFIKEVGESQAELIARWMSLGFIHGVMNTDNFSVGGFTLDYGPCAFMDEFNFQKVFSSIDHHGRYSYKNQIEIGQWNLLRLADSLIKLIDDDQNIAVSKVEDMIGPVLNNFEKQQSIFMAKKFGIEEFRNEDQKIIDFFLNYLHEEKLDFTLSFRKLEDLYNEKKNIFPSMDKLKDFVLLWKKRVSDVSNLNQINPLFIPRNHQVEKAIQDGNNGDYTLFYEIVKVSKAPYEEDEKFSHLSVAPKIENRVTQTFCGT